jgi:hypothetical protein
MKIFWQALLQRTIQVLLKFRTTLKKASYCNYSGTKLDIQVRRLDLVLSKILQALAKN